MFNPELLTEIRARFHHTDECPYQGRRIFFENAGGSLTLKSVVEVNAKLSAIPDNQGRANPASQAMDKLIAQGKSDMRTFLGAPDENTAAENHGVVFIGESGTECLFRLIRAATLASAAGGNVVGSTLEHPATSSALKIWAGHAGKKYIEIAHDANTGGVDAAAYRAAVNRETRVATIIQTSPVSGIAADLPALVQTIKRQSPNCFIVADGIQHAPHGEIDLASYGVDGYAVSAYKVFSRHNYGFGYASKRLAAAPHEHLIGTAKTQWELGTRDASAYATFSEVVNYLCWLGAHFTAANNKRAQILAAAKQIQSHEKELLKMMLNGDGKIPGLASMPRVYIIGGADNPRRAGLVSIGVDGMESKCVVAELSKRGIRAHIRIPDHYSRGVLNPLKLDSCIRVSICHYNSADEARHFLRAMEEIVGS